MFPRLSLLLVLLLQNNINCEILDTKENPVDILELKHVQIKNYNGPLSYETMQSFKNAETLVLRDSNFTVVCESFLNALPNLRKLSMSNCVVTKHEKHDISNCCKNIKELEYIDTGLDAYVDWTKIGVWPALEKIYCLRENTPKFAPNIIKTHSVKELFFLRSNLQSIDVGSMDAYTNLEVLDLSNNKLKEITKEVLEPMKNLKVINLEGNLLEKMTTSQLPSLPHLEKLNIGHNPIKEFNMEGVKAVAPKLSEIDISGIEGVDVLKNGGVNLLKHAVL